MFWTVPFPSWWLIRTSPINRTRNHWDQKGKKIELTQRLNKNLLAASKPHQTRCIFLPEDFSAWVHGIVGVVVIQLDIYRIWFVRATVKVYGFFRYSFKGTSTQSMDCLAAKILKFIAQDISLAYIMPPIHATLWSLPSQSCLLFFFFNNQFTSNNIYQSYTHACNPTPYPPAKVSLWSCYHMKRT